MSEPTDSRTTRDGQQPSPASGLLGGIVELRDGWKLDNGLPNGCSRISRPDGKTAFYRYQETTKEEASLIMWAYEEGHKHGAQEREQRIKDVLGIEAT